MQPEIERLRKLREEQELAESRKRKLEQQKAAKPVASYYSNLSVYDDKFYDPAREYPYKANNISFHRTRRAAIMALAIQFDHSSEWVELNMGTSNSVAEIHHCLVHALFVEYGLR
jgi:hypothetical protein